MSTVYQYEGSDKMTPQSPDNFKKKIILLGVLFLAALIMLALLAVLSGSRNVKESTKDANGNRLQTTAQLDASSTANTYLQALSREDFQAAMNLTSKGSSLRNNTEDSFKQIISSQSVSYNSCSISGVEDADKQLSTATANCGETSLRVNMVKEENKWKVKIIT